MAKTYTTVPDKSSGDTISESNWDSHLKDNLNNLLTKPTAYAYDTTATVAITTATWTAVTLNDGEAWDTDAIHDLVTNPSRLTFTTPGIYLITYRAELAPDAGGTYREAGIRKNGATFLDVDRQAPNASLGARLGKSLVQNFVNGDYVELVVRHDKGSDLNLLGDGTGIYPHLSAVWLSRAS